MNPQNTQNLEMFPKKVMLFDLSRNIDGVHLERNPALEVTNFYLFRVNAKGCWSIDAVVGRKFEGPTTRLQAAKSTSKCAQIFTFSCY